MGAGVAVGPGDTFHVTADWYRNYGANDVHSDRWAAGAEVFFFDMVSLRGGWMFDAGAERPALGARAPASRTAASGPSSPTGRASAAAPSARSPR